MTLAVMRAWLALMADGRFMTRRRTPQLI